MTEARPTPEPTAYAAPYWEAAREHRLVVQHCPRCDRLQHFPRPWCTACLHDTLDWVEVSGLGSVYSYTVVRRTAHPAFTSRVPYVLALVDLDEGVRMYTNLVDCDPDAVRVGDRVRVRFEDGGDGSTIPVFAPADRPLA